MKWTKILKIIKDRRNYIFRLWGNTKMVSIEAERDLAAALEDYLDSRRATESTKERYGRALRKVCAMPDFSADSIRVFLASLRRDGCERSMRFYYFFLKSLVENVLGSKWPLGKKDIPFVPEEPIRPILKGDWVKGMIKKMKNYHMSADLTRFAISTIYGARRIELAELDKDSINLDEKVVRIRTRKHGEFRTHVLPDEIIPYLHPERLRPISLGKMSNIFNQIENFCGINFGNGYGWHSIRRRLATYLDDRGVDERSIFIFMRWKRRETILDTYIVRTPMETEKNRAQVDRAIFKIHPFLSTWSD